MKTALWLRVLVPALLLLEGSIPAQDGPTRSTGSSGKIGVVCHINVLSDKVQDVSSLEAWKKSFIQDGMSDAEKAIAAWKSTAMFQHQDAPPKEYLHAEDDLHDPIKLFNVYGYGMCCNASSAIEALGRSLGLRAHGWSINAHSVPELYYDGAWHLYDASLINYFPKADGKIASVEEIMAAIRDWYEKNPGYKANAAQLRAFNAAEGGQGWKKGPDLLAHCPFYDARGWWPAKTHGWSSTMQEYDGSGGAGGKAFSCEYGYSQGYQVDLRLRPGDRLTRNWSNKGLHVNMREGKAPGCLTMKAGSNSLVYTPKFGDLAPGRVGNGTFEYQMPVASGAWRTGALVAENLAERPQVLDASKPAVLVLRMPTSYVYLSGKLIFTPAVGPGGAVALSFSDNNGLDWKPISRTTSPGEQTVDLDDLVFRRYDYRLKFELSGKGTGIEALRIVHDFQHSQRALPALDAGPNKISFSAGPAEGTVTVEGSVRPDCKGKQLFYTDFHPEVRGMEPNLFVGGSGKGEVTFPIATPGDLVRLRFGCHYRARGAADGIDYQVSFDGAKTWKTVDRAPGGEGGACKYTVSADVPKGIREALVRYSGSSRNATGILGFRIDADYQEPFGGFRPVRVTYHWEENGQARQDVHLARKPDEVWTITCGTKPLMKSIILELAE
ncbi:MAG TPA: hypothetical protein VMU54_08000 [Planctomycetota bacterium]|nr:hypothetical protein [Planctomycetota bacterium]